MDIQEKEQTVLEIESDAGDVNDAQQNGQSTLDKTVDTYKKGKALAERGMEVLDLIESTKIMAIMTVVFTVLAIVIPIGTAIYVGGRAIVEKSAGDEASAAEETAVDSAAENTSGD